MKNLFVKSVAASALTLSIALAAAPVAFAAGATAADGGVGSSDPANSGFQLVSCSGVDDPRTKQVEVECDYAQLIATASRVIQYTFFILAPIVTLMVLVVGWQYLTAGSDTVKLEKAKKMIRPLLLGIVLMSSAYVIVYKFILEKLLAENIGELKKTDIINSGGN